MLVDSPDCAVLRAEMIQDNHDWNADLIRQDGRHRIAGTGVGPDTIVVDRRKQLAAQIQAIGRQTGEWLFIYQTPVAAMVGTDYAAICRSVQQDIRMRAVSVPPLEAGTDWVSGYAQICEIVASRVQLEKLTIDSDIVAIAGYMWDRNEADHTANLAEIERMLSAIGLRLGAVWLSGRPTPHLASVASAGTVLEFPYAGRTARLLAERTGAKVVPVGLPVGLEGTVEWMRTVAAATGRQAEAEKWLAAEVPRCYEAVCKPVLRFIQNRDFMVCTDGILAAAVARLVSELGGRVRLLAGAGPLPHVDIGPAGKLLDAVDCRTLGIEIHRIYESSNRIPVLVGNEPAMCSITSLPVASVPLGFQSAVCHHLFDAPFMGLRGTLCLVDQIVNSLANPLFWNTR